MDVIGDLFNPGGKSCWYPLDTKLSWGRLRFGLEWGGKGEKRSPLRTELQTSGRPVHSPYQWSYNILKKETGHSKLKHTFSKSLFKTVFKILCSSNAKNYILHFSWNVCVPWGRQPFKMLEKITTYLFLSFLDYHMTYKLLTKYISTVYKPHAHHTRRQKLKTYLSTCI